MTQVRLNHFLSRAGVASRRKADELIIQGLVKVNGQKVTMLGTKVDPENGLIEVMGKTIKGQDEYVYYAVNKPLGVVSSTSSQNGETPITTLVPNYPKVFPVGRLDKNSEGLMILTNDGDLAYKMSHPKFTLLKTYEVLVDRQPTMTEIDHLRKGVKLKEGKTAPAKWEVIKREGVNWWLEVKIHQGWNRQIRRMLNVYSITVRQLIRTEIGTINLELLKPGEWRRLTESEISRIL